MENEENVLVDIAALCVAVKTLAGLIPGGAEALLQAAQVQADAAAAAGETAESRQRRAAADTLRLLVPGTPV